MEALIDTIIAFVKATAGGLSFLAAAETMPILIFSTAILIGVATGQRGLPAHLGAWIGSCFSWWPGRRYGEWALRQWLMSKDPQMARARADRLCGWGGAALPVGHFFGPLRAIVFLMAGMSRMPFRRFIGWNIVGVLAWTFLVPRPGKIGGNVLGWLWNLIAG